jgi:2-haloacid dehalogenase
VQALEALKRQYRLAIISNIDDTMIDQTLQSLDVVFDEVVTAQQARSYKPSLNNFNVAMRRLGVPAGRILHVAQSLYHDHVPAKQLGLKTVWVNRKSAVPGTGATPPAEALPDLEVPDMRGLVEALCL